MTIPWAVRLPERFSESLGRIRLMPEIEAAREGDTWWLRGPRLSERLERELARIPSGELFHVLSDGQLRPAGGRVPSGRLLPLNWQPLRNLVVPALPASSFSGRITERCPVKLVRVEAERTPNVLLLSLESFAAWCESAPEIRLNRFRFAARGDGTVLIVGDPLPPLEGLRFVNRDGLAVPVGYGWSPAIGSGLLAQLWELRADDLCLWFADGRAERIRSDQLIQCTRSAVRETFLSLQKEQA